jgi:hypothetical protein
MPYHRRSNLTAHGSRKSDIMREGSNVSEPDGGRSLLLKVLAVALLLTGFMWAAATFIQHST